jgi:hypothetical protein
MGKHAHLFVVSSMHFRVGREEAGGFGQWRFGRKGLREEEGGRAASSLFTEVNGASTTESTAGAV